jgi:Uma2 family endonuclease
MTAHVPPTAASENKKIKKRKVPSYLVRETIDDIPFYYRDYKAVLSKKKTLEETMGDSGLQSIIKAYLMKLFAAQLDWDRYQPVSGEVGNHLDLRTNLSLDLAVYDNAVLTPDKINEKYIAVPPKIVIEIDIRVTLEDSTTDIFDPYILTKVNKLLAFGVERIIWVFTKNNTIIVAKPGNTWEIFRLDDEVVLLEGITMNIGAYLKSKGIGI